MGHGGENGSSTGGNSILNIDFQSRAPIIEAVEEKKKELGLNGYIVCPRCALGIGVNTPSAHIAWRPASGGP